MMSDLGFVVKPVLIIDAKATEHILHRHGIGKMKHIDVARLRLQDEVKVGEPATSRAKTILRTSGRRRSATESSESMRYLWGVLMFKRT